MLACGHGAVLSHRSAAALWCIRPSAGAGVDVTVSGRRAGQAPGHPAPPRALWRAQDIRIRDGIPVTSPARTLVDLADVVSRRAVERAFDEAEYLRLDCTGLTPIAGRPGLGRLRDVLAHHEAGSTRTRSELEERFLELCAGRGLPAPEVNARLNGHEVDFLWRGAGLVVELDGRAAHDTRRAFERDRMRDAELAVAGQRVVRVTPRRLEAASGRAGGADPLAHAAVVKLCLGRRARSARVNAATTFGSNWLPAHDASSDRAVCSDTAGR